MAKTNKKKLPPFPAGETAREMAARSAELRARREREDAEPKLPITTTDIADILYNIGGELWSISQTSRDIARSLIDLGDTLKEQESVATPESE